MIKPDFTLQDVKSGEIYWAEFKGLETDTYRIKRRLWKDYGPGRLEVWKGYGSALKLYETIYSSFEEEQPVETIFDKKAD